MRTAGPTLAVLALLASLASPVAAQDTTAVAARHLLSLELSRLQPFRRSYDMIVHTTPTDSATVIGQRDIALSESGYSGAPAWLLVETRTGIVPAVESLFVAPDLRPLHWSSSLGAARVGVEFVGDSVYGVATMPTGRQNIVRSAQPDLLLSGPMTEMLLPLLPLRLDWSDSVGVLALDAASNRVLPGDLAVVGEEEQPVDLAAARPCWVVALRAGERHVLFWVAKETGETLRIRQPLPAHTGRELEYRLRIEPATEPPR